MDKVQKYKNDIKPYVLEGIVREIFETEGLTVTCLSNSAYAIFLHGLIDPATNLTIGFCLVGKEFEAFMESPTLENFKWLNHVCQTKGENRGFVPSPELMAKFRELKKRLDRERKVEVDLKLEKQVVEDAKRKFGSTSFGSK